MDWGSAEGMPTLHERAEAVRSEWRNSISRWGSSPWEANQESDYSHKEVTAQSGSQGPTGESRHELEDEANTVDFTSPRRRTVPGPGFSSVLEVRQTELVQQDREGRFALALQFGGLDRRRRQQRPDGGGADGGER